MYNKSKFAEWVIHLNQTSSTMADVADVLSRVSPPLDRFLIVADKQTGGIGRNNNTWQSPQGGLWFNYCFKTSIVSHQVTLLLGLCLYEVLSDYFPLLSDSLKIKWPNDIFFSGYKLAGILAEYKQGYLSAGIGINTNVDAALLDNAANPISLAAILSMNISNRAFLTGFLSRFAEAYPNYAEHGIGDYTDKINSILYGKGNKIVFCTSGQQVEGMCFGVSEDGALLIKTEDEVIIPYYSGSINNFLD